MPTRWSSARRSPPESISSERLLPLAHPVLLQVATALLPQYAFPLVLGAVIPEEVGRPRGKIPHPGEHDGLGWLRRRKVPGKLAILPE